jgi:hypothetical protein
MHASRRLPAWLIFDVRQEMKVVAIFMLVLFVACLRGAGESRTLYPLTVNEGFPPEYRKGALAVVSAMSKQGLKPREYSADVAAREGGRVLEFTLWHDSALKQREVPSVLGDPTGKCRTVFYDLKKGAVTKIYGWR